jgi:hypothetical protein
MLGAMVNPARAAAPVFRKLLLDKFDIFKMIFINKFL